ncbi:Scr1 family TA system antitoxin-like transcriptional regulator [Streptomyces sp. HUAS TT20]|uniref:Scr1 family TA system antitoxin-like transcriptional regulator n=1 Tax=Streptomyces sp. HUAS TT20 TaxID=3447509 RepID=UPI00398757A6
MNSQPPIAWRYCGSQIKMWRAEAGIGREALAKEVGYDYEYVKSTENGHRRPTLRLLQIADQVCGAGGKLVAAQEYLKPEPFPARSQEFMAIEAEAISFSCYEPLLIPGLLQTEEYARARARHGAPPPSHAGVHRVRGPGPPRGLRRRPVPGLPYRHTGRPRSLDSHHTRNEARRGDEPPHRRHPRSRRPRRPSPRPSTTSQILSRRIPAAVAPHRLVSPPPHTSQNGERPTVIQPLAEGWRGARGGART